MWAGVSGEGEGCLGDSMRAAIDRLLEKRGTLVAFWIGGCLGILVDFDHGILVDFDHALQYFFFQDQGRRFLHTPILIACCIALCCLGTYIGGLYLKSVLTKRR